MANYRHLIIQLEDGSFDGETFGPAPNKGIKADGLYQPTDAPQTSRYLRLALEEGDVGRLTPAMLGRDGKTNALIRVYSDGAVVSGDTYFGVGSEVEIEASPQSAARTPVVPMDTRLDRAPPIELGPTDDLCFTRTAPGPRSSVHIIIQDLDDNGLLVQSMAVAEESGVLPPADIEVRTMNAGGQILPWTGTLYLRLNCLAGQVFQLPDTATMTAGARLIVVRVGTQEGHVRIEGFNNVHPYNGIADFLFELGGHEGNLVDFINNEWLGQKPALVTLVNIPNAALDADLPLPLLSAPSLHVEANFSARGFLRLPLLASTPLDAVYCITRENSVNREQVTVRPQAGELLAGEVNGFAYLPINGVLVVRRGLAGWLVVGDNIVRPEPLDTFTGNTVLTAFGMGERIVRLNAAAGITLTLPARSLVPTGARLRVVALQTGHTVAAGAGDGITGLTAAAAANTAVAVNIVRMFVAAGANEWLVT